MSVTFPSSSGSDESMEPSICKSRHENQARQEQHRNIPTHSLNDPFPPMNAGETICSWNPHDRPNEIFTDPSFCKQERRCGLSQASLLSDCFQIQDILSDEEDIDDQDYDHEGGTRFPQEEIGGVTPVEDTFETHSTPSPPHQYYTTKEQYDVDHMNKKRSRIWWSRLQNDTPPFKKARVQVTMKTPSDKIFA